VGDQEDGGAKLSSHLPEEPEDLGLDRRVQGSCRLVCDQQSWVGQQGTGDFGNDVEVAEATGGGTIQVNDVKARCPQ
jgi:hypothetical protein